MAAPLASLTVGPFGNDSEAIRTLGSALGKRGTESDLRFWNKKEREVAVTAVTAIGYPERVALILQVASMCDVPWVAADSWPRRARRVTRESRVRTGPKGLSHPRGTDVRSAMKAKLHSIECDPEDLIELPESWIPVRLEPNGYATPNRKAYTLYFLERA